MAILHTPLWPAGHLPRKGGDRMSPSLSSITNVAGTAPSAELLISPLAGEMSGRTEGGAQALPSPVGSTGS
ncbi:lytic murein transglycosylase [Mesorhizobium sp. B2-8-9]|nr:lytic murein transglycosylase [Mesorhizobium sp. B2-8-9]